MGVSFGDRGRTYADLLSLSRLPLAAAIWIAPADTAWVLGVIAMAGLSDLLDGWVARRSTKPISSPEGRRPWLGGGVVLDGLADKVFVVSTVLALAVTMQPPVWVLACLVARELLFAPIFLAYRLARPEVRQTVDLSAGVPGKAATMVQFLALLLGFLGHALFVGASVVAGVLGVVAVAYYVGRTVAARGGGPRRPAADAPT